MDLIAGNFVTNSQLKASVDEHVELTFKEFDNNGSVDPVLTYYVMHKSYPFPSRNEMLIQINSLRVRFPSFESYSDARLTDLFSPENLKTASVLSATK
jgi:hypothetical protein